jgi:hypothetical protein
MKNALTLIKVAVFVLAVAMFLFIAKANAQTRVNIGGPALTDSQGVSWAADTFNLGTPDNGAAVAPVTGVLKTARWFSANTTYSFQVPVDKTYTVKTYSADTWAATQKVGARLWSVDVNGVSRGPIDVFASVGANKPYVETWTAVKPVNGRIQVTFRLGAKDNPLVSAIEILPETSMFDLKAQWNDVTENTDGTPLVGRTGYRIELASSEAGPWVTAATVTTNSSTLKVGYGKSCIRVLTLTATETSEPSASVCVTKAPPPSVPKAPVNVGAQFTGYRPATGSITESFAGFQLIWPPSRGGSLPFSS